MEVVVGRWGGGDFSLFFLKSLKQWGEFKQLGRLRISEVS